MNFYKDIMIRFPEPRTMFLNSDPKYNCFVSMVEEVECAYYGIPDYSLDGIHPEEDTILQEDTVEKDQAVPTITGDLENDVDGRNGAEVKLNLHPKYHSDEICGNYELNPKCQNFHIFFSIGFGGAIL